MPGIPLRFYIAPTHKDKEREALDPNSTHAALDGRRRGWLIAPDHKLEQRAEKKPTV